MMNNQQILPGKSSEQWLRGGVFLRKLSTLIILFLVVESAFGHPYIRLEYTYYDYDIRTMNYCRLLTIIGDRQIHHTYHPFLGFIQPERKSWQMIWDKAKAMLGE